MCCKAPTDRLCKKTREVEDAVRGRGSVRAASEAGWSAARNRVTPTAGEEVEAKREHAADFGTSEKAMPLKAASWARLMAVFKVRAAPTEVARLIAAFRRSEALGREGNSFPVKSQKQIASRESTLVLPTVIG